MAAHSSILAWRIHGQRSLVDYSPWACKESDMTDQLSVCTRACTHTCTHVHAHTHGRAHVHAHTRACTHTCTHACTHTLSQTLLPALSFSGRESSDGLIVPQANKPPCSAWDSQHPSCLLVVSAKQGDKMELFLELLLVKSGQRELWFGFVSPLTLGGIRSDKRCVLVEDLKGTNRRL